MCLIGKKQIQLVKKFQIGACVLGPELYNYNNIVVENVNRRTAGQNEKNHLLR